MLSVPKFGWTNVKIGDFSAPASYIRDVGIDCLESIIYALENKRDFCETFDAEGYEYKIISDDYRTYIINEQTNPPSLIINEDMDKHKLALEIFNDIKNNLKEWEDFPCFHISEDENDDWDETKEFNAYKEDLKNLLTKLEILIRKE